MALTAAYISKKTKLYYMDEDLNFKEYTYIGVRDKKFVVETMAGVEVAMNGSTFGRLCLSKIVILSEIEEQLRNKIEYIHSLMRQHKIAYNPLDTADVVYVNNPFGKANQGKEIYQYHKKTGMFIKSFPNAQVALREVGASSPHTNGGISSVIHGKQRTAFGYRWSDKKFKILK